MPPEQHSDPFTEGLTLSGQRVIQFVASAAAGRQLYKQLRQRLEKAKAARDDATERLAKDLEEATLKEAMGHWSPANDPEWLRTTNLAEAGQAWAAATPYADEVTSAGSAVSKCETRLRELHPYGMQRYDELRGEGKDRVEAMQGAAPFFNRAPNTHTGQAPASRPALPAGNDMAWASSLHRPDRTDLEEAAPQNRASQIAFDLRAKSRELGHDPSPIELRTMLEVTTNLPEDVIVRTVPTRSTAHGSTGVDTPEGRLADEGFPLTVDEALATPAAATPDQSSARKPPTQTPDRNRRRNL